MDDIKPLMDLNEMVFEKNSCTADCSVSERVREDISEMKDALGKIAEALTRLAVLEERHAMVAAITAKVVERVENLEKFEIKTETTFATTITAIKTSWVVMGAIASGLIGLAGFFLSK